MDLIVKWVTQIIAFILIATMIELITPENIMKRYVNLVISLILILIFAQPLLYVLNVDFLSKLDEAETIFFTNDQQLNISEQLIEKQKEEIQAEQDAYILSKVKERLIDEANETLKEEQNVVITDIHFIFTNEIFDQYDNLEEVIVNIQELNQERSHPINPIVINLAEEDRAENLQDDEAIENILRQIWDLHEKQVTIKWEGRPRD